MTGSHLTIGSPASLNPCWQYKTHGAPGVLDRGGGGGGRQTVERGQSVLECVQCRAVCTKFSVPCLGLTDQIWTGALSTSCFLSQYVNRAKC